VGQVNRLSGRSAPDHVGSFQLTIAVPEIEAFMRFVLCAALLNACLFGFVVIVAADGNQPDIRDLLGKATIAANQISDADQKSDTLGGIVMARARTGDIAGAKQAAASNSAINLSLAYGGIAGALAFSGDVNGALEVLKTPNLGADNLPMIYNSIAQVQAIKGDIVGAKATAAKITADFFSAKAQEKIALAEARAGDLPAARATVDAISSPIDVKSTAYVELAELEFRAGKDADARRVMQAAVDTAKQIKDYTAAMTWADVAEGEVQAGDLDSAMKIASAAANESDKSLVLRNIATMQAEMGDLESAKKTAALMGNNSETVSVNLKVAEATAKTGDIASAKKWIDDAEKLIGLAKYPGSRAISVGEIARTKAGVEGLATAAAWAQARTDPGERARALLGVVEAMPDYQDPYRSTALAVKTGEVDLTFTQRSPLSTPKEIARRLNVREHDLGPDYDLSKFPFKAYIPKDYDASQPYGVVVYLGYKDSGTVAIPWEPMLDKNHLIFITPVAHAGHQYQPTIPLWEIIGLSFDGLDNLKHTYNVDPKRIYLMAFDDALQVSFATADVFNGFVVCSSYNYFVKLTAPNGSYYGPTFPPPGGEIFGTAKQRGYALAYSEGEDNASYPSLLLKSMRQIGFNNLLRVKVTTDDVHYPNLKPEWFEQTALPFLDKVSATQVIKPPVIARDAATHPTTERAAAPANNEPEPQHLLKVAKLYIDNGQLNFARPKLETIIRKYPNDPAAATARKLLDQLPPE
jgi:hypothetical protein